MSDKKYKLPREFGRKWIEALRSGEYEQGTGTLYRCDSYCCLGVAGRILGSKDLNYDYLVELDNNTVKQILTPQLRHCLEDTKGNEPRLETVLSDLNDNKKLTFPEIATWIEENVELIDEEIHSIRQ